MSTNASNTLALNNDWLNTDTVNTNYVSVYPNYCYPTTWTYTTTSKVQLTLSEIERLRTAAKKDKKLRETLAKFTDHIEIVVDFGE